jgi:predicted MPP superfamily phosphohydrolase
MCTKNQRTLHGKNAGRPGSASIFENNMQESTDLVYNGLQLTVDVFVVALAARSGRFSRSVLALGAGAASATLLALWLSTDLFHLTRLLTFATFVHGPLLLCAMGWARRHTSVRLSATCWVGALAILAVAADAFLFEPFWLEVSRVELGATQLTRPVRIAVVSDFQTDRIGGYEKRVLTRVMELEPDLVLIPGDYLQASDSARYWRLAGELRGLMESVGFDAPLGVYAVEGNTEHGGWQRIFDGTIVRPLTKTASLSVGELQLTGLGLWDSFDSTLRVPSAERFHVVFGHAPDFALGEIDADLLVAGHTHGGQVRIPVWGPIITFSRVPRTWAAGVTRLPGDRTLVVSRGIGMERGRAPRLRFWCRPEIVIIELRPLPNAAGADGP